MHHRQKRLRLLVLDDDELFAQSLSRMLVRLGIDVWATTTAESILQGCGPARGWRPDAVLVDLVLPPENGVEISSRLRTRWPDVRILFMTAGCDLDLRRRAERFGPVLDKPFAARTVLDLLEQRP